MRVSYILSLVSPRAERQVAMETRCEALNWQYMREDLAQHCPRFPLKWFKRKRGLSQLPLNEFY